ncbi:MAG: hypothetical protein HUU08_01605 [Candidatus Brocadia sp.]|nr:hypothetical protein [Candidatus Brocadia sp.]
MTYLVWVNRLSNLLTKIIAKLDKDMKAVEGIYLLRQEAERWIEKIISEVRGEGNL